MPIPSRDRDSRDNDEMSSGEEHRYGPPRHSYGREFSPTTRREISTRQKSRPTRSTTPDESPNAEFARLAAGRSSGGQANDQPVTENSDDSRQKRTNRITLGSAKPVMKTDPVAKLMESALKEGLTKDQVMTALSSSSNSSCIK